MVDGSDGPKTSGVSVSEGGRKGSFCLPHWTNIVGVLRNPPPLGLPLLFYPVRVEVAHRVHIRKFVNPTDSHRQDWRQKFLRTGPKISGPKEH